MRSARSSLVPRLHVSSRLSGQQVVRTCASLLSANPWTGMNMRAAALPSTIERQTPGVRPPRRNLRQQEQQGDQAAVEH